MAVTTTVRGDWLLERDNVAQVSLSAVYFLIMLFYSCLFSKTSEKIKTSTWKYSFDKELSTFTQNVFNS